MTLKPGDILKRGNETARVLQTLGEGDDQIVFIKGNGINYTAWDLQSYLIKAGWQLDEPKEEWRDGERYWMITNRGGVSQYFWADDRIVAMHSNYTGIYKTEAEALAMRDKVRAFVKGEKM